MQAFLLVFVGAMVSVSASPLLQAPRTSPNSVDEGRPRGPAPLNPFHGQGDEVQRWMDAVRSSVRGPDQPTNQRTSFYDQPTPHPDHVAKVASRTLWFEEFPHKRAVLNWNSKRADQGLSTYSLLSQRPGFPFYRGQ